jgi:hypothetical protein
MLNIPHKYADYRLIRYEYLFNEMFFFYQKNPY